MKNITKKELSDDDFQGRLCEPFGEYDPKKRLYNYGEMIDYAKKKGVGITELSDEEKKMFLNPLFEPPETTSKKED